MRSPPACGAEASLTFVIFSTSGTSASVLFHMMSASPFFSSCLATSDDGTMRMITLSRYGLPSTWYLSLRTSVM